ncbi:NADPH-dependent FMN reductase family protein [Actinacidiphila glaucinigra]|uniref:hypothetical protein n=1 Tax=Actinacidiphila glaucinigra TaxID=235986 RepID=UPI001C65F1E1
MIMTTFTEALDWRGRTVHPVTTYAISGLGTTERDYAASCPGATIPEGPAVLHARPARPVGRSRHLCAGQDRGPRWHAQHLRP